MPRPNLPGGTVCREDRVWTRVGILLQIGFDYDRNIQERDGLPAVVDFGREAGWLGSRSGDNDVGAAGLTPAGREASTIR